MRLVIQRVLKAQVSVHEEVVGKIGAGLFVLVGISPTDSIEVARILAEKVSKMRLMSDENGKMNVSINQAKGEMLVVSQFTLYADTSGGNRPSFIKAARPEVARPIYDEFVSALKKNGLPASTGMFGEYMNIETALDGPVTIIIDSDKA